MEADLLQQDDIFKSEMEAFDGIFLKNITVCKGETSIHINTYIHDNPVYSLIGGCPMFRQTLLGHGCRAKKV